MSVIHLTSLNEHQSGHIVMHRISSPGLLNTGLVNLANKFKQTTTGADRYDFAYKKS